MPRLPAVPTVPLAGPLAGPLVGLLVGSLLPVQNAQRDHKKLITTEDLAVTVAEAAVGATQSRGMHGTEVNGRHMGDTWETHGRRWAKRLSRVRWNGVEWGEDVCAVCMHTV